MEKSNTPTVRSIKAIKQNAFSRSVLPPWLFRRLGLAAIRFIRFTYCTRTELVEVRVGVDGIQGKLRTEVNGTDTWTVT
jgi:hypothetical protein